jgi:hypothetical protein
MGIIQLCSIFPAPAEMMQALVSLRGSDFSSPASFLFTSAFLIYLPNLLHKEVTAWNRKAFSANSPQSSLTETIAYHMKFKHHEICDTDSKLQDCTALGTGDICHYTQPAHRCLTFGLALQSMRSPPTFCQR